MASNQKKIYIAEDGEILYRDEKEEYLINKSDDSEFKKHSEMFIKVVTYSVAKQQLKKNKLVMLRMQYKSLE